MNATHPGFRNHRLHASLLAVALALSGACAFAAGTGEAINSRMDQRLDEQHGRDSVTALSHDPIMMPAQPEAQRFGRAGGFVGTDRVQMLQGARGPSSAAVKTGDSEAGGTALTGGHESESSASGDRFHNTQ